MKEFVDTGSEIYHGNVLDGAKAHHYLKKMLEQKRGLIRNKKIYEKDSCDWFKRFR
jgi:hypothetical protein